MNVVFFLLKIALKLVQKNFACFEVFKYRLLCLQQRFHKELTKYCNKPLTAARLTISSTFREIFAVNSVKTVPLRLQSLMVVENFPLTQLIKLRPFINSNLKKTLTKRSFKNGLKVPSPSPTLHLQNIKRLQI